jgi:osmoprotectant transport system ATP-binding protein
MFNFHSRTTDNTYRGASLPFLSFDSVTYVTGTRNILNGVSFATERGEILVLLGRSGSGKTTALRLVNRLLEPSGGAIYLDGRNTAELDVIALRRKTGYVIQELGLLPHWTVQQNVALVPRLLDWPIEKQQARARELLKQVGLEEEGLAERRPQQLSGGQRQRVAVARALAAEPDLLLFDEPFGALDPVTRREMQQQLLALTKRYNVAVVFVTHDVSEALILANRIAVLANGTLECVVSPEEFLRVNTPVARAFLDTLPERTVARGPEL